MRGNTTIKAALVTAALFLISTDALAQGSAGTGSTYSGIGPRTGPPGPGILSKGWTQQPAIATNPAPPGATNLSPSQKNSIPPASVRR